MPNLLFLKRPKDRAIFVLAAFTAAIGIGSLVDHNPAIGGIAIVVLCSMLVVLSLEASRRIEVALDGIGKNLAKDLKNNYAQLEALIQILPILNLNAPLPPMRGWAISPDFASRLIELIRERQPQLIVELGSGVSTLVSASMLQRFGSGRIVSVDHDEIYSAETARGLQRHGLVDLVSLVSAPLREIETLGRTMQWYSTEWIDQIENIDMLVIDGPPGWIGSLSRFPAVPLLFDRLSSGALIVLDDADRPDERLIVEQWCNHYPTLKVSYLPAEKGIAVLKKP